MYVLEYVDLISNTIIADKFSGSGENLTNLNASNILSGLLLTTFGGTGKSSWTANGIVFASNTSTLAQTVGSNGYVLTGKGSNSAPGWT